MWGLDKRNNLTKISSSYRAESLILLASVAAVLLVLLNMSPVLGQDTCISSAYVTGAGEVQLSTEQATVNFDQFTYLGYGNLGPSVLGDCGSKVAVHLSPDTQLGWKIGSITVNDQIVIPISRNGFSFDYTLTDQNTSVRVAFVPSSENSYSRVWYVANKPLLIGEGSVDWSPAHRGYVPDETTVTLSCHAAEGSEFIRWDMWAAVYYARLLKYVRSSPAIQVSSIQGMNPIFGGPGGFICVTAAHDPPGNSGTCETRFEIEGGGNVFANDQWVNPALNPSILSFECNSAILIRAEAFNGWSLGRIFMRGEYEGEEYYHDGFYITTDVPAITTFTANDNSGSHWVGTGVYPPSGARIERTPNKLGYSSNELISLDCQPADGYDFKEWKSYYAHLSAPLYQDRNDLEFTISGNSYHECQVVPLPRKLTTEAIVKPANASQYTANSLITVNPDFGGDYDNGTYIEISSATPDVDSQICSLNWYWYVPDVSPDWHLLPDHRQTIPVIMDHDKWFRAEWECINQDQAPTPTHTPTPIPTPMPTSTPVPPPPSPQPSPEPTPAAGMCDVTLATSGQGMIEYGALGRTASAVVTLPCGEALALTAWPADGWRFNHLQLERRMTSTTIHIPQYNLIVADGDRITAYFDLGTNARQYLPVVKR